VSVPIANPIVSEAAKEAVCDVLDSGMLADGDVVRSLESEFAEYVEVDHAIATSSGTTALHAMLEAAGIGEDDVVLTSPFSFIASANAIVHAGATPVFADIDPVTYNLDPDSVREKLSQRNDVTALMPVHLYGLPAAMDEFRDIADEYDLQLFEDAAQAHGAEFDGTMVGGLGDAAAFSFYPTKNMTTGEGGMVTTDDDELAARLRQVINHGRTDTYEHEFVGYNFRMTNLQAAIGREQLDQLPEWVNRRVENASKLTAELSDVSGISTPTVPDSHRHAFHQYTIRCENREGIVAELDNRDIGYGVYYPMTIPSQPAYEREAAYPVAEQASHEVLSLPVHPQVSGSDITAIGKAARNAMRGEN